MKDCDTICSDLRDDVHQLRHHNINMKADARCALTRKLVLNSGEPFYAFPSGYVVLQSALKEEVLPYMKDKQRRRVVELIERLNGNMEETRNQHVLQTELNGILAAECPLTGSIMVESIDRDFQDCMEMYEDIDMIDRADV
jgi:vacuolar protein sorting-associated protein 18